MKLRRVVVTGLGALTPIGNTVQEYWNSLKNGVSGAAPGLRPGERKLGVRRPSRPRTGPGGCGVCVRRRQHRLRQHLARPRQLRRRRRMGDADVRRLAAMARLVGRCRRRGDAAGPLRVDSRIRMGRALRRVLDLAADRRRTARDGSGRPSGKRGGRLACRYSASRNARTAGPKRAKSTRNASWPCGDGNARNSTSRPAARNA